MNIAFVRLAAFAVGSLIAGCVYVTHGAQPARGTTARPMPAIYPGAHATHGDPDGDAADADVRLPVVALHLTAARYESDAPPLKILSFYRTELARFGSVRSASGGPNTQIHGFTWRRGPGQTTLEAGDQHMTMVAVGPHGAGSEFAILTIDVDSPVQK